MNTINKIKQHVTSNSAPPTDYCDSDLKTRKISHEEENLSRKVSTESDYTSVSSDYTPENTIIHDDDFVAVKPVPTRKISRFLVSPAALIASEAQQQLENTNEVDSTNQEPFKVQRPVENVNTLEQLKIELENITHAHVPTAKAKDLNPVISEATQTQQQQPLDVNIDNLTSSMSESIPGSLSQDTSVYNSRRTSTDCTEPVVVAQNSDMEIQRKLSQQGSLDRYGNQIFAIQGSQI